jgi:hypothetical protein
MCEAIFLTITRNTKLETGVARFGGTADSATVERFFVASRLSVKPLSPGGDLFPLPQLLNDPRAKENEIITQGHDQGHSIGIRLRNEAEKKEARINPGDPFDLQREDEKNINNLFGIKVCEGEEECRE